MNHTPFTDYLYKNGEENLSFDYILTNRYDLLSSMYNLLGRYI